MTQKMRVIAMDELNQSAREKLMRKNRGKSYPPNQCFRNGCTLVCTVCEDHDVEICARQRAN